MYVFTGLEAAASVLDVVVLRVLRESLLHTFDLPSYSLIQWCAELQRWNDNRSVFEIKTPKCGV